MRTTLDIDDPVLRELKRRAAKRGMSLGRVVSDLLAEALARGAVAAEAPRPFTWTSAPVGGRVDYADGEALWNAIDGFTAAAVHEKRRR